MSATTFTRRMDAVSRCLVSASTDLPGGLHVSINAARHTGLVELGLNTYASPVSCQIFAEFTPEQARAVAAELVACADAHAVVGLEK